jgi:hypothetical protein
VIDPNNEAASALRRGAWRDRGHERSRYSPTDTIGAVMICSYTDTHAD